MLYCRLIPLSFLELLYAATVFLSAFLLFEIQPMIAKMILPWFGGVSTIWSTCMLFFQVVLLFGYLYADWLQRWVAPRRQAIFHSLVLAISLLSLPIVASSSWKPSAGENPSLRILGLLAATVGLPYFMLSTTSSLVQSWYARTHRGAVPYRLFALSNTASLLALVSYPLVVEPAFTTHVQANLWSAAYVCFVALCASTAWLGFAGIPVNVMTTVAHEELVPAPPSTGMKFLWVALAACASILLLATTTFLTQDVVPIPFLWVLPLGVYLVTFIVCFNTPKLYQPRVFIPLVIAGLIAMAMRLRLYGWNGGPVLTIGIFTVSLFVCCMFCHGELVRRKPHPRYLTGFYVMISLGGALGGLFVGLIAPNLFNFYYEFPIGLALCAALVLILTPIPDAAQLRRAWRPVLAVASCCYSAYLGMVVRDGIHGYLEVRRNFYGQLRVDGAGDPQDEDSFHRMVHGRVNHGEQFLNVKYRRTPLTYYCEASGIGQVMAARKPAISQRVGIMGLGCGTLAAYGRRGDTYRFYEINPLVSELANSEFTYLKDSPAGIEIVLGDARLSLERESAQHYDLLVLDAFSGDSVPVHLITREALETYFRHLKPGGLLAMHITNTFLDMRPVVERAATSFGKMAILYALKKSEDDDTCFRSSWVVVADPSIRETSPELFRAGQVLTPYPAFRMWTDDFSSLWGIFY